jgi:hypothetical protein
VYPGAQDPEAQAGPDTLITEIRTYLKDNILPDDMAFANRIARLAKRYTLVERDLYRRGANGILMRCITRKKTATYSQMSMEVSAGTMHLPARWSVKPFGMDFTGLQPSRTSSNW